MKEIFGEKGYDEEAREKLHAETRKGEGRLSRGMTKVQRFVETSRIECECGGGLRREGSLEVAAGLTAMCIDLRRRGGFRWENESKRGTGIAGGMRLLKGIQDLLRKKQQKSGQLATGGGLRRVSGRL